MTDETPEARFVDLRNNQRDRDLLARFFEEVFVPGFPYPDERESLDTLLQNLVNIETKFYGRNAYHIILALIDERPVAGCLADYMFESNCGAIEYILVDEAHRGRGLGRAIHDHTVEVLEKDAAAAGRGRLDAVMVEINDPFQISAEADNVDPFERVAMWHRWGYRRLRFPYEQPALSEDQGAVTYLLLGVLPRSPSLERSFPAAVARQMVVDYLVWANRLVNFVADPFYVAMSGYADAHPHIEVQSLLGYIGRDPGAPLVVSELRSGADPAFAETIEVYRRIFPPGDTAIDPQRFAIGLETPRADGVRYNVWGLAESSDGPLHGMASFFSAPASGFLGYLGLEPPKRGKGLARVVAKRIEERLIRDHAEVRYWFVECDPGSPQLRTFAALGFRPLRLSYHQPPLHETADRMAELGPPMVLLAKKLGDDVLWQGLADADALAALADILRYVYRLDRPELSICYRIAEESLRTTS